MELRDGIFCLIVGRVHVAAFWSRPATQPFVYWIYMPTENYGKRVVYYFFMSPGMKRQEINNAELDKLWSDSM